MFFQIVDELASNPKIQALTRRAMTGDITGVAAIGLWSVAGSCCQAGLTDGIVTVETLIANLLNRDVAVMIAEQLVEVGLWHAHGHSCERCPDPPQGAYVFHDWFDLGYEIGEDVRTTRGKRKELKDKKITTAVWMRDRVGEPKPGGDVEATCRYCGKTIWRNDRGSWQFDHVHPKKYLGSRNIVIACRECNQSKAGRLPSEAGMVLHKPGWRPGSADWSNPLEKTKELEASLVAGTNPSDVSSPARTTVQGPVAGGVTAGMVSPASRENGINARGLVAEATAAEFASPARTTVQGLDAEAIGGRFASPAGLDVESTDTDRPDLEEHAAAAQIDAAAARIPAAAAGSQVSSRARAWQGRAGQGRERVEEGSGQGSGGAGQGEPASPRRRRRAQRRRLDSSGPLPGREPEPVEADAATGLGCWDAGEAPVPVVAGEFGSPWFGWWGRGPADDEALCPIHGDHVPCRHCLREEWVNGHEV